MGLQRRIGTVSQWGRPKRACKPTEKAREWRQMTNTVRPPQQITSRVHSESGNDRDSAQGEPTLSDVDSDSVHSTEGESEHTSRTRRLVDTNIDFPHTLPSQQLIKICHHYIIWGSNCSTIITSVRKRCSTLGHLDKHHGGTGHKQWREDLQDSCNNGNQHW